MPVCPSIVELGAGFGGYWCSPDGWGVRSGVSHGIHKDALWKVTIFSLAKATARR